MADGTATFQRARSNEQREIRRQAILQTAAAMLIQMPVAELSLNELSRRVGLAKSNVLRYFESREAVLLELLDAAWRDWLDELVTELAATVVPGSPTATRQKQVAGTIAGTMTAEPMLWQLISVSAAVLEHNVSPAVARRYKLTSIANTERLGRLIGTCVPEVAEAGAFHVAGAGLLAIGATWPLGHPSEAMLRVYEDDDMAAARIDAPATLRDVLVTLLIGSTARWPTQSPSRVPVDHQTRP